MSPLVMLSSLLILFLASVSRRYGSPSWECTNATRLSIVDDYRYAVPFVARRQTLVANHIVHGNYSTNFKHLATLLRGLFGDNALFGTTTTHFYGEFIPILHVTPNGSSAQWLTPAVPNSIQISIYNTNLFADINLRQRLVRY